MIARFSYLLTQIIEASVQSAHLAIHASHIFDMAQLCTSIVCRIMVSQHSTFPVTSGSHVHVYTYLDLALHCADI